MPCSTRDSLPHFLGSTRPCLPTLAGLCTATRTKPALRLVVTRHLFKPRGENPQISLDVWQIRLARQLSKFFGKLAVQVGCRLFRVTHSGHPATNLLTI